MSLYFGAIVFITHDRVNKISCLNHFGSKPQQMSRSFRCLLVLSIVLLPQWQVGRYIATMASWTLYCHNGKLDVILPQWQVGRYIENEMIQCCFGFRDLLEIFGRILLFGRLHRLYNLRPGMSPCIHDTDVIRYIELKQH